MAASVIAACLHEDGHDVQSKTDRRIDLTILDGHWNFDRVTSVSHLDLRGTVCNRKELHAIPTHERFILDRYRGLISDINSQSIWQDGLHKDRLMITLRRQMNIGGSHNNGCRSWILSSSN